MPPSFWFTVILSDKQISSIVQITYFFQTSQLGKAFPSSVSLVPAYITVIVFDLINNHISSRSRESGFGHAWTCRRRTCERSSVTSRLSPSTEVAQTITSGNSLTRRSFQTAATRFGSWKFALLLTSDFVAAVSKHNQLRPAQKNGIFA